MGLYNSHFFQKNYVEMLTGQLLHRKYACLCIYLKYTHYATAVWPGELKFQGFHSVSLYAVTLPMYQYLSQ